MSCVSLARTLFLCVITNNCIHVAPGYTVTIYTVPYFHHVSCSGYHLIMKKSEFRKLTRGLHVGCVIKVTIIVKLACSVMFSKWHGLNLIDLLTIKLAGLVGAALLILDLGLNFKQCFAPNNLLLLSFVQNSLPMTHWVLLSHACYRERTILALNQ